MVQNYATARSVSATSQKLGLDIYQPTGQPLPSYVPHTWFNIRLT